MNTFFFFLILDFDEYIYFILQKYVNSFFFFTNSNQSKCKLLFLHFKLNIFSYFIYGLILIIEVQAFEKDYGCIKYV